MRKIKRRELIPDDRVIITGHWWHSSRHSPPESDKLIGKHATVIHIHKNRAMPIEIKIDGTKGNYSWIRENLRAIPRTKKLVLKKNDHGQVNIER